MLLVKACCAELKKEEGNADWVNHHLRLVLEEGGATF